MAIDYAMLPTRPESYGCDGWIERTQKSSWRGATADQYHMFTVDSDLWWAKSDELADYAYNECQLCCCRCPSPPPPPLIADQLKSQQLCSFRGGLPEELIIIICRHGFCIKCCHQRVRDATTDSSPEWITINTGLSCDWNGWIKAILKCLEVNLIQWFP